MLLSAACAHIEAPTGGPVDSIAPRLVVTRPDTNAVLERWLGPVVFAFDEELSEEGVDEAVTLSPRRGPVSVDKEGDEIRVRPRRGWEPGLIYQVEVAPGIRDRFNNPTETAVRLVFTTGPPIPATRATGAVRDRVTGEPSQQARVDALRIADSLVYSTQTDSAGRYFFTQVPEGEYRVIGYRDTNKNRRVDSYEQRDTAVLNLVAGQASTADLALLPNDTTGPTVGSARMAEGWIEVRFDDYLDPEQPLSPQQVVVIGPDSAAVAIAEVRIGPPPRVDTAGAARDSMPPEAPPAGVQRPDSARADTTSRGPLPSQSLFARPGVELIPDTVYRVRVSNVRNVNGLVGGGEAPLRTPRPPPPPAPADTAAVDTVAVPPDSAAPALADSAAAPVDSAAIPSQAAAARRKDARQRLPEIRPPGWEGAARGEGAVRVAGSALVAPLPRALREGSRGDGTGHARNLQFERSRSDRTRWF